MIKYIYKGSDFRLDITVTDADGAAVLDAVVTAQIKDSQDTLITNSDITLTHSANGLYQGWMPNTLDVTENEEYYLIIIVVADGKTSRFKESLIANYKGVNSEVSR